MVIDKQKEIIELRKLYLMQCEKFETKVFFTSITSSFSLILLAVKEKVPYWWGISLLLFTLIFLDFILECWRKNNYNKLIKEIQSGKVLRC